jgi:hypothetical protein
VVGVIQVGLGGWVEGGVGGAVHVAWVVLGRAVGAWTSESLEWCKACMRVCDHTWHD